MARKSLVKDLSGNIIHMVDETNGGYIIRNRQVVDQERWGEYLRKEQDKKLAAQAIQHQKVDENAPDRNTPPNQTKKIDELEQKVNGLDSKIDQILKALQK